jgi:ADP-dependent NAD(P)H-hydrate dehydratase
MSAVPLTPEVLRAWPLPELGPEADKDSRGRVLVVGGGAACPGAVRLAGEAALRSGAGKVQVATAASAALPLAVAFPESRVIGLPQTEAGELAGEVGPELPDLAGRTDAVAVGPGMLDESAAEAMTCAMLEAVPEAAFLLDAAVLPRLSACAERLAGRLVAITPHAGEMARLLNRTRDVIEADPETTAKETAARFGVVVALKGAVTFIAAPDGRSWVHRDSPRGLGTAGSGDVLAGLCAGLLARGADPVQALLYGVWAHAEAGRRVAARVGPIGYLARELTPELPGALANLS